MAIFKKLPIETLVFSKDRWMPLYLEHGKLNIKDSALIWKNRDDQEIPIQWQISIQFFLVQEHHSLILLSRFAQK